MSKPGRPADEEAPDARRPERPGERPASDVGPRDGPGASGAPDDASEQPGDPPPELPDDALLTPREQRDATGPYDAVETREQVAVPDPFATDEQIAAYDSYRGEPLLPDSEDEQDWSWDVGPGPDPFGHDAVAGDDRFPRVGAVLDDEATATGLDPPTSGVGQAIAYAETASVVRPPLRGPEVFTLELPLGGGERRPAEGRRAALDLEPTHARATVLSNWSKAVAGLRVEASRVSDNGLRSRLLTVAAGLTWQLIGDANDAEHLFDQALQASPEAAFAHRERALMRLREGRDPIEVLEQAAEGLRPRDHYDHRRRVRGRFYLLASVLALKRSAEGDASALDRCERFLELAHGDLGNTTLLALWEAYRSFWEGRSDFPHRYLAALRTSRVPRLRAALLADLATGLWCGRYGRDELSDLEPTELLREAVSLADSSEPYETLLRLISARDLTTHHRELQSELERGVTEPLALRAAAVAEAAGEPNQALGVLQLLQGQGGYAVDWRLLRLAARWGEAEGAVEAVRRLRRRAPGPLAGATLALEEASLHAMRGDRDAWASCIREAFTLSADLDTARFELGRHCLTSGAYRELLDLRGYDVLAKATTHTRRGEILETRLNSPVEAITEYQSALRLDPADEVAFRALERLYTLTGDYDAFAALYRERVAHAENPEQAADWLRLAAHVEVFERANPPAALPLYEHLRELVPHDAVVRAEYIALLFRTDQDEAACRLADDCFGEVVADDEVRLLANDRLNHLDVPISVDTLLAYRARVGASPIVSERLEIATLVEGRYQDLFDHVQTAGDGSRDYELLGGHLLTLLGRPEEAADRLERWTARYREDAAAELLLTEALQAARSSDRLQRRFEDEAVAHTHAGEVGRWWIAWRRSGFAVEAARGLADATDAVYDRRVVWATTLAGAASADNRAEAAEELLRLEPASRLLQALAEVTLVEAGRRDALLRLQVEWARTVRGLDRDVIIHRLAQSCLALGRYREAAAVWRELAQRRADFVPAWVGRAQALAQAGDSEGALVAERELLDLHGLTLDDAGGLRRRLEARFDGGDGDDLAALIALELSELAGAGDPTSARLWALRALERAPDCEAVHRRLIGLPPTGDGDLSLPDELQGEVELGHHLLYLGASPERALGVFLAAVTADAGPEGIAGLLALGRRRDEPELAVEALRGWSRTGRDPHLLLHADLETARLAELFCDDPSAGIEAYERAFTRQPDAAWVASHLARLAASETTAPSSERRERLGGLAGQGAAAAPALFHLAKTLPPRERADTLAFILSLDPHFVPAEWALLSMPGRPLPDAALARRGRRRRCPALLVASARRTFAQGDAEAAESLLYEALSLSTDEDVASFGGPYDGLIRLLRDSGRGIELIALGEDLVGRAATGAVRRRLLEAAVRVALMPATSRSVARTALLHLVEERPGDRALLRRAMALVAQSSDWERVAKLLEAELPIVAERFPTLVPLVWWERGEIARRVFDDDEAALAAFQRAREASPTNPFVHSAIGRLLIELGRWDDLVEHTRAQLVAETQPERIARLHVNLAGIEEFHRLDSRRALEHYLEALAEYPESRSALLGTVRVAERAGQPPAAAVAMEALASFLPGPHGEALWLRAAEIAELHSGEKGLALGLYRRLAEAGHEAWVRFGLDACELSEGGVDALFREKSSVSAEPSLRTLLTAQRDVEWDFEAAAPSPVWASRIFRESGDFDGRRARFAAARLGEQLGDASAAADMLRLGLLVGALRGAPADVDLRRTLVLLDPADELGLLKLEAEAEPGSGDERWALDARIRIAPHGLQRAEAMTALVRHFAVRGQDDQLWDTLDRISTEAPELPLTPHFRAALSTNVDEPAQAAERLEQEAKVAGSKARSAQLWLQAAKLRRRQLGEIERAVADLWSALEADPTLPDAFHELREMLVTQGDMEGLFQLFDLRYRGVSDSAERVDLLTRMAELAHHRLEDVARAAWCHRQILRHDPTHVRSYRILAEILGAAGQDAEVAEMLEAVVQHTDRPHLEIKTLLELAELYAASLGQFDQAEARYRDVLQLDPEHSKARAGLAQIAEANGHWDEAARHLEHLARRAGNRPRASELYLRLARALENGSGAGAHERVAWALRRAVEVKPDHVEAIRALTQYVSELGDTRPIELIVKQVAERFGGDEAAPAEDRALRLLFELFERLGWRRRTELVTAALRFLGYQTDRTEAYRQAVAHGQPAWHRVRSMPADETAFVFPPQLKAPLINVLRHLESALVRAFPSRAKLLGASRRTRVGRDPRHPANALARMFGRPDTEIYACLAPMTRPVLEPGLGPSLLLPADFDDEPLDDGRVWSVAYVLAPAAMGVASLARLPAITFVDVLVRVIRGVEPQYLARELRVGLDHELYERLDATLGRRALEPIAADLRALAALDYDALEIQHRLLLVSFARLAALACLDLHAALTEAAVAGPGPTCARAVVPFVLGAEFDRLQRAAGMIPDERP